jgi:hypothetical protein
MFDTGPSVSRSATSISNCESNTHSLKCVEVGAVHSPTYHSLHPPTYLSPPFIQVRENFDSFSGQELACVAWALRRFGYTGEANAVIYMMERQDSFRLVDFEILSNSKLLSQVC